MHSEEIEKINEYRQTIESFQASSPINVSERKFGAVVAGYSSSSPVEGATSIPQPKTIGWTLLAGTFWALVTVLSAGHWYAIVSLMLSIGAVLDYLTAWIGQHNRMRYALIKTFENSNLPQGHFLTGLPPRLQRIYALSAQSSLRRFGLPGRFILHIVVDPALAFLAPEKKGRKTDRAIALDKKGHKTDKAIALEARIRELEAQVEKLMQENVSLTKMAYIDELTGLYNRAYYREFITHLLRLADQEGFPISVIMVDGDKFKDVNDRFGHHVGRRHRRVRNARCRRRNRYAVGRRGRREGDIRSRSADHRYEPRRQRHAAANRQRSDVRPH